MWMLRLKNNVHADEIILLLIEKNININEKWCKVLCRKYIKDETTTRWVLNIIKADYEGEEIKTYIEK